VFIGTWEELNVLKRILAKGLVVDNQYLRESKVKTWMYLFYTNSKRVSGYKINLLPAIWDNDEGYIDDYDLLVGSTKSLNGVCKDCDSIEIQSGKFLVFETDIKQIATDVSGLWMKIWNYFKTCDIKRSYLSDFEKYIDNKVEIYISIL